jgi:hypothetical protein
MVRPTLEVVLTDTPAHLLRKKTVTPASAARRHVGVWRQGIIRN